MTEILRPDLCVIGGGPGGIAAARRAAGLGATVVLVDRRPLGATEHLRYAWQSQALAAAAARAAGLRSGARLGLAESDVRFEFWRMRSESEAIVRHFAREDNSARLAALNIRIVPASGAFTSRSRFEAGKIAIEARRFLLAVGSVPAPPAIPGLELVRPLTQARIADLTSLPKRVVVIGANPECLVLAQSFLRLGSQVVLLQSGPFLPGEDPELTAPLCGTLRGEGLEIIENAEIRGIELPGPGLKVVLADGAAVEGSDLIHASARMPLVEGLALKAARVAYDRTGIRLNADRRSSNRKIYAINDGLDSVQSMTAARQDAEFVVDSLFGSRRPAALQVARIIATDPEIAVVGLSEDSASKKHRAIRVLRAGFCDDLRAWTSIQRGGQSVAGHVKIIIDARGYLLGAGIVGPHARELIGIFGLGLANGLKAEDLTPLAASEPTLTDVCRSAALASVPQTGKGGARRKFSIWRSSR